MNLSRDKSRQWLLNSFNVADIVQQSHTLQNRILLEDIPCGSEYLSVVIEAMQKNKTLMINYMPFYNNEPETLHLQLYCMKVHRQRWYIAGYMQERDDIRQIALDRTLSMTLTDTGFKMPKDFFPEDYYSNHEGIWVNKNIQPERVILRAYGLQSQYLQKLPLHHTQKPINETPKFTDYQYRIGITHEFIYELLSMADSIEVLEPIYLRKKMLRTVQNITNRYRHINQKFPDYKEHVE